MRIPKWFIVELNTMEKIDSYPDHKTAVLALADLEKANPLGCYKLSCKWGNL